MTVDVYLGTNHIELKPYSCPICYKGFVRKDNLKRHKATECHKSFGKKTSQKSVKVSETCKFCKKEFFDISTLKRHCKNIHFVVVDTRQRSSNEEIPPNEVPSSASTSNKTEYKCNPCQKTFSNKWSFQRHMKLLQHGPKINAEIKCQQRLLNIFMEYENSLYINK